MSCGYWPPCAGWRRNSVLRKTGRRAGMRVRNCLMHQRNQVGVVREAMIPISLGESGRRPLSSSDCRRASLSTPPAGIDTPCIGWAAAMPCLFPWLHRTHHRASTSTRILGLNQLSRASSVTLLPNWLPRYATRAHRLASDEPLRAESAPLPYFRSPPSVCRRAISVCAGVLRREVAEGGNADRA